MDIRPAEQRLIDLAPQLPSGRMLCNTVGRAQLAQALARRDSQAAVACFFLDLYQLQESQLALGRMPPNLQLVCQADPPPEEFDVLVWSCSRQGDAELTRDLLQAGHERLVMGGRMAIAIDNPRDQWLHEQLRGMFDKVTRQPYPDAVVYLATKTRPLKKHKDFACEFTFRDGEQLIQLRTRPGVFSHREVDGGARALVKAMQIEPQMRVLDLGCGSGAVGVAAALRAEGVQVLALDSNPRAVEAALWAAERNGVRSLAAALDCDGTSAAAESMDLVLTNPPYYSNFRIARLFMAIARRVLRPGGKLLVVTKTADWYRTHLIAPFQGVAERQVGAFQVVEAAKA